eukprot:13392256-Alexandrium_andersonii.AAC.1
MDLENAFYSVEQVLVFSRPRGTHTELWDRLSAAGASPELLEEVAVALAAPAAGTQAGIPEAIAR